METDATTEAKKEEGTKEAEKKEEGKEKTEETDKEKEEKKDDKPEDDKKVSVSLNACTNTLSLKAVDYFFRVCLNVCSSDTSKSVRSRRDNDADM